jgi:mRNA-degrading endonuclease RelE of RelBE toxin-antitoxin system
MVDVEVTPRFQKALSKTDVSTREKVLKQIEKVESNPEIGKPMRYARKGTQELHIAPFRLSYAYIKDENKIVLLDLYNKDEQ